MPHVNIKHFPTPVGEEQSARLVAAITAALTENLGCTEDAVSIALEPVDPSEWNERVYRPEVVERRALLHKQPNY
ncbi:hypothetical protein SSP531S_51780 [Streptomyces spongiicola]|uniref:4-oxalocrotonate tautomerase n=1 Tax=Streptomyces spongiicola TaxID=1690221 RepID=A0A2S1Z2V9_9ACTN|nr:tautomerase family protein [Streptomyces spongiicola]AWK10724.1 4-oxalocrotonate tautomerase [Streptomyces spongiicola]GBQ03703.1 hypothetical protein SSP531S_51780 [Streptomyces spongiicola]